MFSLHSQPSRGKTTQHIRVYAYKCRYLNIYYSVVFQFIMWPLAHHIAPLSLNLNLNIQNIFSFIFSISVCFVFSFFFFSLLYNLCLLTVIISSFFLLFSFFLHNFFLVSLVVVCSQTRYHVTQFAIINPRNSKTNLLSSGEKWLRRGFCCVC